MTTNNLTTYVYIVVKYQEDEPYKSIQMIESVWNSVELAKSAIQYHAMNGHQKNLGFKPDRYSIIEREINKANK